MAVTSTGLVVIRFTPADNRFQLRRVNGAVNPTQTEATWELPIARMTGGAMTDIRDLVTRGTTTNSMIEAGAVTTSKIADGAVTATKLSPGSVTAFVNMGGTVNNANTTLTASYQRVAQVSYTRPGSWNTYELMIWGSADDRSPLLRDGFGSGQFR